MRNYSKSNSEFEPNLVTVTLEKFQTNFTTKLYFTTIFPVLSFWQSYSNVHRRFCWKKVPDALFLPIVKCYSLLQAYETVKQRSSEIFAENCPNLSNTYFFIFQVEEMYYCMTKFDYYAISALIWLWKSLISAYFQAEVDKLRFGRRIDPRVKAG